MAPTLEEQRERRTTLTRERAQIKSRITKLKNHLEKSGSYADPQYVDRNLSKIKQDLETLPEIQAALTALEPGIDHTEATETITDDFEDLMVMIRRFKDPNRDSNAQTSQQRETRSAAGSPHLANHDYYLSLPKMEVKRFDGKLENWRPWRDWFIPTIHNRDTLTDAQRLDFMKRTTSGEAANTISAFAITDENYKAAWKLLESTYDIEHVLVLHHYDRLMQTPVMKKNSAEEIRKLVNHVQTQVLAMKGLGEKVEHWDTPLVYTLLNRLDKETAKEWNRTQQGNKMPTYEELMNFLRKEAVKVTSMTPTGAIPSISSNSNAQKQKNGNYKAHGQKAYSLLTSTADKSCPLCKEQHMLENCRKFITLTVPERIQAARSTHLCLNCLRPNHKTRYCKCSTCATCQKKHNTLLHLAEADLGAIKSPSA
ncbi:uncharacterized protein LOC135171778 [Diachasmimorpha longicaudata]|uniref:uncharacterized protein LOC135171627 n=1 Tax=Diachasmimorpha longicaudata TaxID=58733 RepID=UPI0030B8F41E